jgi:hypothetical protein
MKILFQDGRGEKKDNFFNLLSHFLVLKKLRVAKTEVPVAKMTQNLSTKIGKAGLS